METTYINPDGQETVADAPVEESKEHYNEVEDEEEEQDSDNEENSDATEDLQEEGTGFFESAYERVFGGTPVTTGNTRNARRPTVTSTSSGNARGGINPSIGGINQPSTSGGTTSVHTGQPIKGSTGGSGNTNQKSNLQGPSNARAGGYTYPYNPYEFDINLNTSQGRKAYAAAVKGLDEDQKYDLNPDGAEDFFQAAVEASETYCWGDVVEKVGISWDYYHKPIETKNLFDNRAELSFDEVEVAAQYRWGCKLDCKEIDSSGDVPDLKQHQDRLRATMIARWIMNSLTIEGKRDLILEEDNFTYWSNGRRERDGPSMLHLIFDKVNPNTTVGVMRFKALIQSASIDKYEGDVSKMLDGMAANYRMILRKNSTHDDYLMHIFNALETVNDDKFSAFVNDERRNFEMNRQRPGYSHRDLIRSAREVFNNLVARGAYDFKRNMKKTIPNPGVDVKQTDKTKLLAFLAQNLKRGRNGLNGRWSEVEDWRFEKKAFKVERNGKSWWWCDHHKGKDGELTGMYVRHPPNDHAEWLRDKRAYLEKRSRLERASGTDDNTGSQRLQIDDNLRAALMTQLDLTEEQVDVFCTAYNADFH